MSGIFKSVKKVFKKAVKAVRKIAPIALAAAAIYFTAGGSIAGIGGSVGGWGDAVSDVVGKMGAGGLLGDVLTGAVTQAGYGAIAGGVVGAVTGNDVIDSMGLGAVAGGITGSATGAYTNLTAPNPLAAGGPSSGMGAANGPGGVGGGVAQGAAPVSSPIAPSTLVASTGAVPAVSSPLSFSDKALDFAKSAGGGALLGNVGSGLGQGLIAMASSNDESDAIKQAAEERRLLSQEERDAIAANYGSPKGLMTAQSSQYSGSGNPLPDNRFRWRFNPETGRVEQVGGA